MNAVSVKREATRSTWMELAEKMAEVIGQKAWVETSIYTKTVIMVYMQEGKWWFGMPHYETVAKIVTWEGSIQVRHDKVETLKGVIEAFAQEYETTVKILDVDKVE